MAGTSFFFLILVVMAKAVLSPLLTSISGSVGNITFSAQGSMQLVKAKCSNVISDSDPRRLYLEMYRAAVTAASLYSVQEVDYLIQLLTLFPKYQGSNSSFLKNVYSHIANIVFLQSLNDETPAPNYVFAPLLSDNYANAAYISAGRLYIGFHRETAYSERRMAVYVSKRYLVAKAYKARYTSYMGTLVNWLYDLDITDAYIARFGILPSPGEVVAITSTFYSPTAYHINSDVTNFVTVT
jgi:hypothetical protein